MKRFLLVLTGALTLCAGAAVAVASATPPAPPAPSYARLRHFVCQRALDPASRAVSTTAVMHALKSTATLSMRFQLLSRSGPGHRWTAVKGHDLNAWISPAPAAPTLGQRPGDVWTVNKPVGNLVAPATYRIRVSFRWTVADKVIASAVRTTPNCAQPELRPDLAVRSVAVSADPTYPGMDDYAATVHNNGVSAAGPFEVQFTSGATSTTKRRSTLAPGATTTVRFRGPVCSPAAPPTITADPNDQVDDYNRANNAETAACPSATAAQARRPA
jgi:hypothetical protein